MQVEVISMCIFILERAFLVLLCLKIYLISGDPDMCESPVAPRIDSRNYIITKTKGSDF